MRCSAQRCTADPGPSRTQSALATIPGLQRTTSLRFVLRCARETHVANSLQPELAIDGADLGRLDQARMRHRHRVQRALELLQPEIEELVELGKGRAEVVILPDISLQQPGVIGPPVEDVGRRQSVAFKLAAKLLRTPILRIHDALQSQHRNVSRLAPSLQASKLNKLFTFKALAA